MKINKKPESCFRLLQKTDVIFAGDQFLEDDCENWKDILAIGENCLDKVWMIGKKYDPSFFQPMRRNIS